MLREHKKPASTPEVTSKSPPKKTIEVKVIGSEGGGKTTIIQWLHGKNLIAKQDEETGEWKHEVHEPVDEKSSLSELKERAGEVSYQEQRLAADAEKWHSDTCLLIVVPYDEIKVIEKVSRSDEIVGMLKILRKKGMFNTIIENNVIFIIPYQTISQAFDLEKFLAKKIELLTTSSTQSEETQLLISLLTEMKVSRGKNKLFMLSAADICNKGSSAKLAMIKHFYLQILSEIEESEVTYESSLATKHRATSSVEREEKDSRNISIVGIDDTGSLSYVNATLDYLTRDPLTRFKFGKRFLYNKSAVHLQLERRSRVLLLLDEKDLASKNQEFIKYVMREFISKFSINISDNAFLVVYRGPVKLGTQLHEAINQLFQGVAGVVSFDPKNIININLDDKGASGKLVHERLTACTPVNTGFQFQVNPQFIDVLHNQITNEKTLTCGLIGVSLLIVTRIDFTKQLIVIALLILSLLTLKKVIKPGIKRMGEGLHSFFAGTTVRVDEVLGNINSILKSTDTGVSSISNSLNKVFDSFNMSIQVLTDRADQTLQLSADQIKLLTSNANDVISLSREQIQALNTNLNKILVVTQDQITGIGTAASHSIRLTGLAIDRLGASSDHVLQLTGEQIRGIGSQTNQLVRLTSEQVGRLGHRVDGLLVLSGRELQAMRRELSANITRTVGTFSTLIQGVNQQFNESSRQIQRFVQSRDRGLTAIERGAVGTIASVDRFVQSRDRGFGQIEQGTVDALAGLRGSITNLSDEIQRQIHSTGAVVDRNLEVLLRDFNESSQRLMTNLGDAARSGQLAPRVDVHDNPVNVDTQVRIGDICVIL